MTTAIDNRTIARWRLANQRLTSDDPASIFDTVAHLVCVQAENHQQASWAVAARSADATQDAFAEAFDRGDILRTHVLRPTWHFVTPADIGWLLDLTSPRLRTSRRRRAAQCGLDERQLVEAANLITAAIDMHGPLRRADLAHRLRVASLPSKGQPLALALEFAEVEGLICSGPILEGEHTHALLEQRAPHTRRLDRDTALAEIALRYVTSHGPATEADLAYWASLTLTDARAGIRSVADQLADFDHNGRTYWHRNDTQPPDPPTDPRAHILQILDECYRGYQDSRWVLDTDHLVPRSREKTTGMVLVDAQIVATMRRTVTADHVRFTLGAFRELSAAELDAVAIEAQRYATFLDLDSQIIWDSPL